jgi:ABC-2 type transport system permease protein
MIKRITAIVRKEFHHIIRDWQTLMIVLLMPVIMMFLYGYALTMDLSEVKCLVIDPLHSVETRSITKSIDATTLFNLIGNASVTDNPEELFRKYHVKAIFRFSPEFSSQLRNGGKNASIQVLIDGSDPNIGTILKNAVEPMLLSMTMKQLGIKQPDIVKIDTRILYNPQQKSALYFVPGLMAIIILMISALLTSLAITREKELGTMEQLLVSPLRPGEIIIGKIIPYIALAAFAGFFILLIGRIVFGVTISGSIPLLIMATLLYIFTALSIGLLLSTIASNQQQAMMMVLPITMLPTIILSGFIFPLASLPLFLRCLSYIVPATYFLEIIRAIILKGIGIYILWKPILILTSIGIFLVVISIKKFKVRL